MSVDTTVLVIRRIRSEATAGGGTDAPTAAGLSALTASGNWQIPKTLESLLARPDAYGPATRAMLATMIGSRSSDVRWAGFLALRSAPDAVALPLIAKGLASPEARTRSAASFAAIGRTSVAGLDQNIAMLKSLDYEQVRAGLVTAQRLVESHTRIPADQRKDLLRALLMVNARYKGPHCAGYRSKILGFVSALAV
jgi:hypothetical protein